MSMCCTFIYNNDEFNCLNSNTFLHYITPINSGKLSFIARSIYILQKIKMPMLISHSESAFKLRIKNHIFCGIILKYFKREVVIIYI